MFSEHDIQPVFEMINGTDMPRFLVQNIAQAQEMLEAVQHPALKMQYDCYHMAMMGEDVLQGLQENIQAIGHIQFADCPGRHEPDTAQIMYANIFEWLQHSSYDGFIAAISTKNCFNSVLCMEGKILCCTSSKLNHCGFEIFGLKTLYYKMSYCPEKFPL